MSRSSQIDVIMHRLINVHEHTWMQTHINEIDHVETYAQFLEWNAHCLNEQTDAQLDWLMELCRQIRSERICLMDLDSCAVFEAFAIYYTKDKKLCIVNAR